MIIGHQKQRQFLKGLVKFKEIPHAYLFCGQEKLGKKTIALEFAKLLNESYLIGTQNPDLILIEPKGSIIQISQIRELNWKLSLKPSFALFKIVIIDQAHCMNQEAQSCFLKTLEEPKGKTLLILISDQPQKLFSTTLSRVQKIRFLPVRTTEIENYLKNQGIETKKIKEIIEFSLGRPGIALDFLSYPEKLEKQKKIIQELTNISMTSIAFRFQYIEALSKIQNLKEVLNIWLAYFRNILLQSLGQKTKVSIYPIQKLKNILKQIQKTDFLLSTTNANSRLSLEKLILEL